MLFLCSIELVQKSPVSLRVNVVPAIEWLNIDCHTNFDADNSWMEFASVSSEKGNFVTDYAFRFSFYVTLEQFRFLIPKKLKEFYS